MRSGSPMVGARAACVSLLVASSLLAQADGWPHWRGPMRDGLSRETEWTAAGREQPLWRAELGLGYSNVSIRAGRLFTLGYDEAAQHDHLYCLDAVTGAERWRRSWPAEVRANFHGGGTLTTPTIDGEVLFVSNREGRCMALNAGDGSERWHRNYGEELGLEITFHGFSASPLALEDRLILVLGGNVLALDKATGDVLWRSRDFGDGGYSNPVPFELDGEPRLCVFAGVGLLVLDTASGTELYRYPWKPKAGGVNVCTPIVFGRKVFISSAYDQGAALLELGEESTPKLLWRSRCMRNKVSGCTLWGDHIYGFDESMLKCIDLEGNDKWRVRGLGMGSVAVAGGRLIVLTSKGELIVAPASPEGFTPLAKRKVLDDGVYWTTPVLLDGRIYCRNSLGSLVCLDHRLAEGRNDGAVSTVAEDTPRDLPDAAALFAAHERQIGGPALAKRTSARLQGTIEILGDGITQTSMTIDCAASGESLLTYDLGRFGRVQRCFDGEVGWVLDPFYGDRVLEGVELRELRETRRLHAPVEWRTAYPELGSVRRANFADRPCWVVAARSAGGASRRFYFDVESGRLAGHDADGESMVVMRDWRAFDGVEFPTRMTIVAPETGAEENYVIDSVTWDEVAETVFARPDAVRRMLRSPEEIEAANRAARTKFASYLGKYSGELPSGTTVIEVTVTDGDLTIERDGRPPMPFRAGEGEHRFVERQSDRVSIEFRVDAGGAVDGLVLTAGEQTFTFARAR